MILRRRLPRVAPLPITIVCILFLFVSNVSADTTYVVQRGDTLYRIALNHGLTTEQLARANNIVNPDVIYAGQTLVIPDGRLTDEESNPESEVEAVQNTPTTYVIQRGDTLFRIASNFGLSTQVLAQANGISNPSFIYAGQVLTIPEGVGDTSGPPPISNQNRSERWVDVNLSTQRLTAYQGDQAVYSTFVSSGTWDHPTVTGQFQVYLRYESQTMNGYRLGYDYYLPNVPYVMYFYRDYALHGTYWHNNFGTPMSHGCVNMTTPDAQWLFQWSGYGTPVSVHF